METPTQQPETKSIDVMRAAADNPRTISAEHLAGLGVSMETFGDLAVIVWNERSGNLVTAHQRMENLRAAGAKDWTRISKDEGFILDPRTGQRFKIRIVDWDRATEMAARIAANNPETQGEFTDDVVAQLKELEEQTRFEELQLAALLKEYEDSGGAEPRERRTLEDFDATPPPKRAWIMVATNADVAAEIEAELRTKYDGADVRIEVSGVG
jgi:hypothetical protein